MKIVFCENEHVKEIEKFLPDIEKTAFSAMTFEGVDGQADVMFVSKEEIKDLNARFRDIDKVTDVLSFPANDLYAPISMSDDIDDLEEDIETGEIVLGDIAVCVDKAKEQAEEYGHSLKRELCFLVLHGCLHIMGYDHIEEEDEKVMLEAQKKILGSLGISR